MDEKRRRFRFRLRTLLVGITLAGVLCARGAPIVQKWQQDAADQARLSERIATALQRIKGCGLRGHLLCEQSITAQRQPQK